MSKQIIQIEELIYKRMPKVSAQEWLAMLKEQFSVDESYGLLLEDYLLQEQTDNYYIDGHLVDSERVVYNINHLYHISSQPKPTISEEDTWEDPWVQYDASNNRYIVRYCHYLCEDLPHITNQLCEADMPIHGKSTQAPPETQITTQPQKKLLTNLITHPTPQPIPQSHPQPQTKPAKREVHFKKWQKHNLHLLEDLYKRGFNAQEIAKFMAVSEEGLKYQLTHYLGHKNIFVEPMWKPRNTATKASTQSVEKPIEKRIKLWNELEIGDSVKHATLGKGIISKFRTNDKGEKFITIKYDYNIQKEYGYTEGIMNKFFMILTQK